MYIYDNIVALILLFVRASLRETEWDNDLAQDHIVKIIDVVDLVRILAQAPDTPGAPFLPFQRAELAVREMLALMDSSVSMEDAKQENGIPTGSTALWTAPPALVLVAVVVLNRGIMSTLQLKVAVANRHSRATMMDV